MARPRRRTKPSRILRHLTLENARSLVEALWRIFLPLYTIKAFRENEWIIGYIAILTFRTYYGWKMNRLYNELLRKAERADKSISSTINDGEKMEEYQKPASISCVTEFLVLIPHGDIECMFYQMMVPTFTMGLSFMQVLEIEKMAGYIKREMGHLERDSKYCRECMEERADEILNDKDGWHRVTIESEDLKIDYVRPVAPRDEEPKILKDTGNLPSKLYVLVCFGALYLTFSYPDVVDLNWLYTSTYLFFIANQIIQLRKLSIEHRTLELRLQQVYDDLNTASCIMSDLICNY